MPTHTAFHARVYDARLHGPPVRVDVEARIVLAGMGEHACRIVEASTGEMGFETPLKPAFGDRVIVYAREFGRLEGDVERQAQCGFAIALDLPEARRRRLAGQLIWMANRDSANLPDIRRHKRFVPKMPWTSVRMPDGRERFAQINDVSLNGVSVDAAAKVSVGDRVAFGVKAAVVGRVFDGGFAAEFEEPFAESELSEALRL
ncbi:PilZ domain-containing protein [Methylocystis sp. JAN1]|uniref:PilZ domain-containing protein n=1 Tax=Methylocystis sp. JAN1 TaxID=3397211 RepID=UPI003FA218D1